MGTNVFANGMEIACKSSSGKSVAAFPDVCFTPPQAPPTPMGVPVPYPNTGLASDMTGGSKTVKIVGKEVMLKDKSYFKKSSGDEAGSASKKGVVTSTNRGKVYFNAWSMDVKIEGENVVRHLDPTTHNHASVPGNTPTWPFLASMSMVQAGGACENEANKKKEACDGKNTKEERCASEPCKKAMKCELQPYSSGKERGCCTGQTPHHLVEVHCFTPPGGRNAGERLAGFQNYDDKKAPCVCCDDSSRFNGDHGELHGIQGVAERACMNPKGPRSQMGGLDGKWTYKRSKEAGLIAHKATFKDSGCSEKCLEAQLDAYHQQCGIKDDTLVRADRSPLTKEQKAMGESVLSKLPGPRLSLV